MNSELIQQLEALVAIPDAEIRARANAPRELKQALNAAIVALIAADATKQSSPEMSTLAAEILQLEPPIFGPDTPEDISAFAEQLLSDAKRLAGCVLAQDQTPGQGEPVAQEDDPEARAARALADAQRGGQAHPIVATVPILNTPEEAQKVSSFNVADLEQENDG